MSENKPSSQLNPSVLSPSALSRAILRHSLMLGAFAGIAALLLGLVNASTKQQIVLQIQAAERRALYEVFPLTKHNNDLLNASIELSPDLSKFNNIELLGLSETRLGYTARLNETVSGVILPVEAHDGYSGDILLLVGINADASLSGVRVLSHKETPGLGDKIDLRVSDWILQFNLRSLNDPSSQKWQVKKDGGDFDQFVGATVTPRAIVNSVKNALVFFSENQNVLLDNDED